MIFETQVVSRKNTRPVEDDWWPQDAKNELDAAERTASRMQDECNVYEDSDKIFVLVRKPEPRAIVRKFQVVKKFTAAAV